MIRRSNLVVMAASLALGGCASAWNTANESEFSCPGMPKGVMCASPRQAYELSNDDVSAPAQMPGRSAATGMPEGWNGKAPLQLSVLHTVAGSLPTPVLEQAQVMRIYIAPWIDGRNDVHWPSYIFSEVQAKRWRIGLPATRQAAEAVPYRAGASTSNAVMAGAAGGLPGKAANRAEAASAAVADALAPSTPDKGQGDLKTLTSDVPVE